MQLTDFSWWLNFAQEHWGKVLSFLGGLFSGWFSAYWKFSFEKSKRLEISRREILQIWRQELLSKHHFEIQPSKKGTFIFSGSTPLKTSAEALKSLQKSACFFQFYESTEENFRNKIKIIIKKANETPPNTAVILLGNPNHIHSSVLADSAEILSAYSLRDQIGVEITRIAKIWRLE